MRCFEMPLDRREVEGVGSGCPHGRGYPGGVKFGAGWLAG